MLQFSDILEEYRERIENNVQEAIYMQNLARETASRDKNGNWQFTISQKNDTILEVMTLNISKENVPFFAPEDIVANKTLELAREEILEKDINFKNSKKTKFEYFAGLNNKDRQDFDGKVHEYIANRPQLKLEATKELLISNGIMPRIVNRALQQSANTAQQMNMLSDAQISANKDNGYCTKSLFIPLYELKNYYGGFDWLPDSAEIASHPQTMINHLKTSRKDAMSSVVNLNSAITNYEPGAIVMVDQGNGHMHAMMYNGINKDTGKPQYIGFNSNDFNRNLSDKRIGIIINLPQMIKEDIDNGKIRIAEKHSAKETNQESSPITINLPEQKGQQSIVSLSRGEKARYVSLKISRLRSIRLKDNQTLPEQKLKGNTNQPTQLLGSDGAAARIAQIRRSYTK